VQRKFQNSERGAVSLSLEEGDTEGTPSSLIFLLRVFFGSTGDIAISLAEVPSSRPEVGGDWREEKY
jgi:hypothetical protein